MYSSNFLKLDLMRKKEESEVLLLMEELRFKKKKKKEIDWLQSSSFDET